jgi:hypothetical protein
VEEASGVNEGSPLVVGLHLFKVVLVDHCGESSVETSLKTLRRLGCDLDGHLKKTEREFIVGLASDPETEIFVDLNSLREENFFHLRHELERQMAVVEDDPGTRNESSLNHLESRLLLLFSHGDLPSRELLLLLGKLVDVTSGIGSR